MPQTRSLPFLLGLAAALVSAPPASAQDVGDPATEQDWAEFFPPAPPVDLAGIKDSLKPRLVPWVVGVREGGEGAPATASGVVLAQEAGACTVATLARGDGPLAVRFHGAPEWVPAARVLAKVEGTDVVLIEVPRDGQALAPAFEHFMPAPALTVFDRVPANVVGTRTGEDGSSVWEWTKGTLRSGPQERVLFEATGEAPVPAGAALLNTDLEFVGLVLDVATDGPREALSHAALLEAARGAGLELDLVETPLHHLLVTLSRQQGVGTLVVRTERDGRFVHTWFALRMRMQIGSLFGADIVGYHVGTYVELDLGRSGPVFRWPKNLRVDFDALGRFEPLDPDTLPGFLVLRAEGEAISAHLAFPTGDAQLLGTLALTAGVNSSWLKNYGGRHVARPLSGIAGGTRAVLVGGEPPLFPIHVPATDEEGGLGFRLPGAIATGGGRLSALYALTDVHEEIDARVERQRLSEQVLCVFGDAPEPLGTWNLAEAPRGRIDVRIPAGTDRLRWTTVGRPVPQALVALFEAVLTIEPE